MVLWVILCLKAKPGGYEKNLQVFILIGTVSLKAQGATMRLYVTLLPCYATRVASPIIPEPAYKLGSTDRKCKYVK
jgi:hypothetical protein